MTDPNRDEEAIFHVARALSSERARAEYLASACAGAPALLQRVRALLDVHGKGETLGAVQIRHPDFPSSGDLIGRYKLLEQIGEGGFGVVFMAEQQQPVRRKVAVKIIKPGMDAQGVVARFEAERQALAMMDHPNIAKVLDGGATDSGRPYFVMELVAGVPVTRYCDENRLTPRQRLGLFVQVCHAVQHAHQKGIIHRDLKPCNVLVAVQDERGVPKVIDFGIAKAAGQQLTDKTLFTQFAQMVGTPLYMSPEQAQLGGGDVDTRSDVYSLGVLLYELLTGTTPFDGERIGKAGLDEMRRIIREEDPPKPSTRLTTAAELPTIAARRGLEPRKLSGLVRGELDWIVMKALEKDRARRYESANGLARDVERYLANEAVQACPPSAFYRVRKFARRHRARLAVASSLLLGVLVAVGAAGWALRDRAATRASVAARAEHALGESEAYHRQRQLPEAVRVARSALALVQGGAGSPQVERRAREWLNDLETVARLEEINPRGDGDWSKKLVEYPQAFREYGIDIEALSVEEAAARIAARPVRVDLAVALDRWVLYVFNWGAQMGLEGEKGAALRRRLGQIARLADPDPLRNRLRDAYRDANTGKEDAHELRELAASVDLAATPIATLMLIGDSLEGPTAGAEFYTRVQRQHPSDFGVTFGLGRMLRIRSEPDRAVRFLTSAVALRPQSRFARSELGEALLGKGEFDEAVITYKEVLRLWPSSGSIRMRLGVALRAKGSFDEAEACFREVLRQHPEYPAAHYCLAGLLSQQGRIDEAIAAFRDGIRLSPAHAPARYELGTLLDRKGFPEEALVEYREAVRAWPQDPVARHHLGAALEERGLLDEAIAEKREAARLRPGEAQYQINLGMALAAKRGAALDEAVSCLREAVRLEPNNDVAHNQLGVALRNKGLLDEAVAAHREAIRLRPAGDNASVLYHDLGHSLSAKGLREEAIAAYREAVRLQPDEPVAHGSLGFELEKRGSLDEAAAAYAEAIRLRPGEPGSHYRLGSVCAFQGRWDKATPAFGRAVELQPSGVHALYRYATLCFIRGDLDGHARACRALLAVADGTRDMLLADCVAKSCALDPGMAGEAERVGKLAALAPNPGRSSDSIQWFNVTQGLVAYRSERFGPAVEAVVGSSPKVEGHHRDALAFSVMAMAQHRLGKSREAHAALYNAQRIITTKMPDPQKGQMFRDDWHDWLHCQALCREAEKLLTE